MRFHLIGSQHVEVCPLLSADIQNPVKAMHECEGERHSGVWRAPHRYIRIALIAMEKGEIRKRGLIHELQPRKRR